MEQSNSHSSSNQFCGLSVLQHRNKSQRNLRHLSFNINRMRRRSGGIHCQSPEEFVQLSQKSIQSTGLFYEDRFNRDCFQKCCEGIQEQRKDVFSSFNFDIDDEESRDEKTLDEQIASLPSINVTSVIICQETRQVKSILDSRGVEDRRNQPRNIDLVVRHRDTPSGQKIIFKYWLIEKETCNSTLAQIYLGIAKQIYSTSNCSIKNFQTFFLYNTSNLDEKIEADEQKTLERY